MDGAEPWAAVAGRGLFVCVEGIDGAGKTTAVAAAGDALSAMGLPVVAFDKKDTGFGSGYVRRHLGGLRELICGHPPDDPYLELGDLHWVHLQAAWYAALAECRVRPLVEAGRIVLTDTWTFKFLAKLRLRPGVDFPLVRSLFASLPVPDLVVHLRVDPAVAARRRTAFGRSEAGNHEGAVELSAEAFTTYQTRLAAVLAGFARDGGWSTLDATDLDVAGTAKAVADLVAAAHAGSGRR